MNALTFRIRLLEPVLLGQAESGEPNSRVSLNYLSGSAIRGAVIAQYIKENGEIDAGTSPASDLFFNGQVRYLNAYPAHPETGVRALPRPLSWLLPKDEASDLAPGTSLYDFAIAIPDWSKQEPPKPPGKDNYCWIDQKGVQLIKPTMHIMVHNTSTDANRKDQDSSNVFRYESIAPGQEFIGVIVAEDSDLLQKRIQPLLQKGGWNLGGAHTGGYGRVQIDQVAFSANWKEYDEEKKEEPDPKDMSFEDLEAMFAQAELKDAAILTCLSDVIWRNGDGQISADLAGLIEGVKPDEIEAFRRTNVTGGFNRKWGLPLPQALTIEAGTVMAFPGKYYETLREMVDAGIGERRVEGYGRIAVNWHTKTERIVQSPPPPQVAVQLPERLTPISEALAKWMAQRQLENQIEMKLVEQVHTLTGRGFRSLPAASQLSQARLAARRAWYKGDLREVLTFFEKQSDLSQRKWQDARMGGDKLRNWIEQQAKGGNLNWVGEMPTVAGVKAPMDLELRQRTLARLIEDVLRQAVRFAKKQREGGNS